MSHLSLSDLLLTSSERLFPLAILGCDLGIWLLVVPGKFFEAL